MYLSRFEFNSQRRESARLLASPQRMHAVILGSFPQSAETGRVLWRLDRTEHRRVELLLVSAAPPDLTGLQESCGWPTTATWQTADYGRLLGRLSLGQRWRFRVTANPVVSRGSGERGKRLALSAPDQLSWLVGRAAQAGFDIGSDEEPTATVTRRATERFRRGSAQEFVTLSTAQFDGVLTVTDPAALRAVLVGGLGGAKAYGCGLLTLAPTD